MTFRRRNFNNVFLIRCRTSKLSYEFQRFFDVDIVRVAKSFRMQINHFCCVVYFGFFFQLFDQGTETTDDASYTYNTVHDLLLPVPAYARGIAGAPGKRARAG